MTEERLKEIFIEAVFPTVGVTDETLLWFETRDLREDYIEAMKQAVNEALEEAAEKAELKNEFKSQPGHGTKAGGGAWRETMVDKQSILNLKVK